MAFVGVCSATGLPQRSCQLRTFKQVMFKLGLMEKSTSVVDLFVPKPSRLPGTPTRRAGYYFLL
jgi:hypothetical protein